MTAALSWIVASAALALAAPPAVTVPPPSAPGAWRQLGTAVASKAGKRVFFFRIATPYPRSLAVVASSSSDGPIRLHWYSYCELLSDDEAFQEHASTVTGVHAVVAYPPVFDGATLCYISVYAQAGPGAVVDAGAFTT